MGIDLAFNTGQNRLNIRAAAVIIHDGYLLCDREEGIDWAFLPGGRVKRGETSRQALIREMREELNIDINVRSPHFITESFFFHEDLRFHEMGFYFLVKKPENLAFTPNDVCHVHEEDGKKFVHSWVPLDLKSLEEAQVQPKALLPHFIDLPPSPIHVIIDEISKGT
jgi:8-oxo-dGTP pyrophosphatase MutT (NUDIX family)